MAETIWRIGITALMVLLLILQYRSFSSLRDFTQKPHSNDNVVLGGEANTYPGSTPPVSNPGSGSCTDTAMTRLSKDDVNSIAKALSMIVQKEKAMTRTETEERLKQTKQQKISTSASLEYYQESEQLISTIAAQGALDNTSLSRLRELNGKISIAHKKKLLDKIIKMYERNEITSDMLDHILM